MLFKKNQFKRLTEITNMALPLYDVVLVRKIKPQKGAKNKLLEVVAITFQENEEIPIFIDKISSKCEMISILQKENEDNVKILYFEDKNHTIILLKLLKMELILTPLKMELKDISNMLRKTKSSLHILNMVQLGLINNVGTMIILSKIPTSLNG